MQDPAAFLFMVSFFLVFVYKISYYSAYRSGSKDSDNTSLDPSLGQASGCGNCGLFSKVGTYPSKALLHTSITENFYRMRHVCCGFAVVHHKISDLCCSACHNGFTTLS